MLIVRVEVTKELVIAILGVSRRLKKIVSDRSCAKTNIKNTQALAEFHRSEKAIHRESAIWDTWFRPPAANIIMYTYHVGQIGNETGKISWAPVLRMTRSIKEMNSIFFLLLYVQSLTTTSKPAISF